jgi:hypothetical protein
MKTEVLEKEIIITPENLPEQKMSTLFYSAIDDIGKARKAGFDIYMGAWGAEAGTLLTTSKCAVCLGGAALLGFVPLEQISKGVANEINYLAMHGGGPSDMYIDGVKFSPLEADDAKAMTRMFDGFREGQIRSAIYHYNSFAYDLISERDEDNILFGYGKTNFYGGRLGVPAIIALKKDLRRFAEIAEEYNH